MTHMTIRSKTSLYNQQDIKTLVNTCTRTPFKIKRKGKHCFYITFDKHISPSTASRIASKLGLEVSYTSDVRCILSDNFDALAY